MWPILAKVTLVTWLGTSALDGGLTIYGVKTGVGQETNPVLSGAVWTVPVLKGGVGALSVYGWKRLRREGKHKTAFWLGVAGTVGYGFLSVHNVNVIRGERR